MKALLLLVAYAVAGATVRNVTCSGDITSALQSAIASSADRDEVSIGAGSCTISAMISWSNKNIDLHGAGIGSTTITSTHANSSLSITMDNYLKSSWQVHDFVLMDNSSNPYGVMQIHAEYSMQAGSGWRIHHARISSGTGTNGLLTIHGLSYGLIDHVTFDMAPSSSTAIDVSAGMANLDVDAVHSYTLAPSAAKLAGTYNKSLSLNLGTAEAIYVEDCTFNMAKGSPSGVFDSNSGGARVVLRHNTMNGYVYAHWTQYAGIYGTKYEVYNNVVDCQGSVFARLEAGTGVIWGNQLSNCSAGIWIDERRGERSDTRDPLGACDGTKPWDGNVEPSGWPCLGQVGRGAGAPGAEESVPLYAWNNGPEATCATGGACTNTYNITLVGTGGSISPAVFLKSTPHANGQVDFVNGGSNPKPGYKPFVYPHPSQSSATTVAPPSNISIWVQ